jgi:hypothetical protein
VSCKKGETYYDLRSNHYSRCAVGSAGLAKHNEDGTGVRVTVWMVFCFTEQNIASHTTERILTASVADSVAYIVLRGKYVEIVSQSFYKTSHFRAKHASLESN